MCAQAQVVVVDVAQLFAKACPVRFKAVKVEIYAENGAGNPRLGGPQFRCRLRCLRSLRRTVYTSWRSRLMFSTLMWCAPLIGRSTHLAEFRLLAAYLDEWGTCFRGRAGRQAGQAGQAGR